MLIAGTVYLAEVSASGRGNESVGTVIDCAPVANAVVSGFVRSTQGRLLQSHATSASRRFTTNVLETVLVEWSASVAVIVSVMGVEGAVKVVPFVFP